ncbi:MAG TPA: patatin-like phospholipase family protein [Thermoanaerobaculia bacterium]|nr:patatin-like phospholipase family protein [Thermoanaerobaculia bacterium]
MAGDDAPPEVIGLALSGGGFRAAAFHLGVLKRLRELGLLSRLHILSTVSGGSIAGAVWAFLHSAVGMEAASDGHTITEEDVWSDVESTLLSTMIRGVRGVVVLSAFIFPAVVLALIAGGVLLLSGVTMPRILVAVVAVLALAYVCWHYFAAAALEKCYEKDFYGKLKLKDIAALPLVMLNATTLNFGHHVVFSNMEPDTSYAGLLSDLMRRTTARSALLRSRPSISMPRATTIARAVAASSAFPGAFAPLRFTRVFDRVVGFFRKPLWGESVSSGELSVIDGGVFDNQGTHLIGHLCHHLIISDGAGALQEQRRPSTWQIWPPGKGIIFRAQDIIYERLRDLGYAHLEERRAFSETLLRCAGAETMREMERERQGPYLRSYSYVELMPPKRFAWIDGEQRLPEELLPLVAAIRTDLDRFSKIEISALMFHGYTMIDHCLRVYQRELYPADAPPLRFTLPPGGVFANWSNPTPEEIARAAAHLQVSSARSGLWRGLYRRAKSV